MVYKHQISKGDSVRLSPDSINHNFTLWSLFVLNQQDLNWLTGSFCNNVYLHHQMLNEVRFALALRIPVPMFSFDWLQLWMWPLLVPVTKGFIIIQRLQNRTRGHVIHMVWCIQLRCEREGTNKPDCDLFELCNKNGLPKRTSLF